MGKTRPDSRARRARFNPTGLPSVRDAQLEAEQQEAAPDVLSNAIAEAEAKGVPPIVARVRRPGRPGPGRLGSER